MTTIVRNLQLVRDRITTACFAAGRNPASVRLLAVSKTFGADAVRDAMTDGQRAFGENYIAEGVEKISAIKNVSDGGAGALVSGDADGLRLSASRHSTGLRSPQAGPLSIPVEWHCIGPIQSNKTRLVAAHFDWVQSVDRLKIAERLSEQRPESLPPLQICLQVNMDGGANKSGVGPEEVQDLAEAVARLPRLVLRGFMSIPEPAPDFQAACAVHAATRALFDRVNREAKLSVPMDTLSMGMTADLEAAIHSGSTMVRVGTAIFGGR